MAAQAERKPKPSDVTSDLLYTEGDEYILLEFDEAGEKKVDALGYPQDGRHYRCRTFTVPGRGKSCSCWEQSVARLLEYRDSYPLFNKNKSLYKIIATQKEKEDLIERGILPFLYRSRQTAIVTACSMFRLGEQGAKARFHRGRSWRRSCRRQTGWRTPRIPTRKGGVLEWTGIRRNATARSYCHGTACDGQRCG
jgi:hypothetical protein